MQSPEQRYTALFPGKPDRLERHIPYQDQELQQTLEAVKVDDDIYSVSSIKLSVNQADIAQRIIVQLQSNLLDRAKASGGSVLVENASYQMTNNQRLPVSDYFISFVGAGKVQQMMRVRWITRIASNGEVWIYQVSALHSNPNADDAKILLSKEEYSNFFNEFRPE